ncbi:MAG: hypothetical protein K2L87_05030, partial [Clostridiales bacterium]|nr:hypothetical protein [Clostridiales bacterium]
MLAITLVTAIAGFLSLPSAQKADALTNANINNSYRIGANGNGTVLTEVYNSSNDQFNPDYMRELCSKLIGTANADIKAVENYINANGAVQFGSKVVKASQINANAGNANNGITLMLGGQQWMAASLTIDNNGNVILTLYMAGVGARIHPSTIDYDSSTLRSTTLSNYSTFASGAFATKYLVQPKNIAYQTNQSLSNGTKPQNGALTATSKWGDDYIWIPSDKEVIAFDDGGKTIWGLTSAQLGFTGTDLWAWARSKSHDGLVVVGNAAASNWGYINSSGYTPHIRPAIHLNLSEACGLKIPTYVPAVYNGGDQKVETMATKPDWYNGAAMTIAYDSTPKDVGTYTGTVTLNGDYFWSDNTTTAKTFTFEITQKPVGLTLGTDTSTGLPTATVNTADLCGSDAAPNVVFRYTGNGYNSTTPPTTVGTYTATAEISDTNSNYKLDNTYTQPVTVTARKVAVPVVVGSANLTYDGTEQTLTLQNAGADVNIVCPTTGGITFADGKLKVTDAGTYTVRATLK